MWPILRSLRWNCFCIPLISALAAAIAVVFMTLWLETKRCVGDEIIVKTRLQTIACILESHSQHDYPVLIENQSRLSLTDWVALAVYAPTSSASQTSLYPRIAGQRLVPREDEENVHPCVTTQTTGCVLRGPEGWYGAIPFSASQGTVYVVAGLMHVSPSLWPLGSVFIAGILLVGLLGAWYAYRHLYQPVESVLEQAQAALAGQSVLPDGIRSAETEALSSSVQDLAERYRSLAVRSGETQPTPSEQ